MLRFRDTLFRMVSKRLYDNTHDYPKELISIERTFIDMAYFVSFPKDNISLLDITVRIRRVGPQVTIQSDAKVNCLCSLLP